MNESRLIWEIGPNGEELRTLRARLSLDSGYLTRVMGSLEKQGLVTVRSTKQDGRVRRAHLTKAGLRERAELDRCSDDLALHILEILTDKQRKQLTSAWGRWSVYSRPLWFALKLRIPPVLTPYGASNSILLN